MEDSAKSWTLILCVVRLYSRSVYFTIGNNQEEGVVESIDCEWRLLRLVFSSRANSSSLRLRFADSWLASFDARIDTLHSQTATMASVSID